MEKKIIYLTTIIAILCIIFGCEAGDSSTSAPQKIEFDDGIYVSVDMPAGFDVIPNPYEETRFQRRIDYLPQQTLGIEKDGELVGNITLVDRRDNFGLGLDEDQWIEVGRNNSGAVYETLFMAQLNDNWEEGYEEIYTSDGGLEGSALSYVLYNSAIMEQGWYGDWEPDLSACAKEEPNYDGDSRVYYYNRAILGYNLNLKYWVAIELNYNSISDTEHIQIAEALQIEQSNK